MRTKNRTGVYYNWQLVLICTAYVAMYAIVVSRNDTAKPFLDTPPLILAAWVIASACFGAIQSIRDAVPSAAETATWISAYLWSALILIAATVAISIGTPVAEIPVAALILVTDIVLLGLFTVLPILGGLWFRRHFMRTQPAVFVPQSCQYDISRRTRSSVEH